MPSGAALAQTAHGAARGRRESRGERRDGRGEGPTLFSSERVQKEGSGRCAADAGRKVRKRNEKECNKLAVRLFSTCIKTSSGATDDLESIARHFPRPSTGALAPPPLSPREPRRPHYLTRPGPHGPRGSQGPDRALGSSTALRAREQRTANRANVRIPSNWLAVSYHVTFQHFA